MKRRYLVNWGVKMTPLCQRQKKQMNENGKSALQTSPKHAALGTMRHLFDGIEDLFSEDCRNSPLNLIEITRNVSKTESTKYRQRPTETYTDTSYFFVRVRHCRIVVTSDIQKWVRAIKWQFFNNCMT